jgi:pimeloyl-ACP methyl ester carboxylesterase
VVQGIDARCGTVVVPENRAKPSSRTIGLRVVVLPASSKPAREDAVAYLAGGPGSAATEEAIDQGWDSSALRLDHDLLLVDQRGTGSSNRHGGDVTPLLVSRAAEGDYAPLERAGSGDLNVTLGLMSSIWCNEPWAGLDASTRS